MRLKYFSLKKMANQASVYTFQIIESLVEIGWFQTPGNTDTNPFIGEHR
jgi:hypothetical protein